MEQRKVLRVWTPEEKPVVLDKFCHLSLDSQKVMAALYRDFHQRRAEISRDIGFQTSGFSSMPSTRDGYRERQYQDPRQHYEKEHSHGMSGCTSEPQNTGYADTGKSLLPFTVTDVTSSYFQQPVANNVASNYFQQPVANNVASNYFQQPVANDVTSNYFQQPATNDVTSNYFQQPVANDVTSNCFQQPEANDVTLNYFQQPVANDVTSNYFQQPVANDVTSNYSHQSKNSVKSICTERRKSHPMMTFNDSNTNTMDTSKQLDSFECETGSPAVETTDFEILSQLQIIDTQRDLFLGSDADSSSVHSVGMADRGQLDGDLKPSDVMNSRNYLNSASGRDFMDCGQMGAGKGVTDRGRFGCDLMSSELMDKKTCLNNAKARDLMDCGQISTGNKHEVKRKFTTPLQSDTGFCDESPYLNNTTKTSGQPYRTPGVLSRQTADMSRTKQKCQLKQTRLNFEIMRTVDDKGNKQDSTTGNKNYEEDSSEVPCKKLKACNQIGRSAADDLSSKVVYMQELSVSQVEKVCSKILEATEVVLCLVFTTGCTQLRENLFGAENKVQRKQAAKLKKDSDVDSIALWMSDDSGSKLYLFSIQDQQPTVYEKLREFWSTLLSMDKIRKIGFQTKDILLALIKQFNFSIDRVNLSWTLLDTGIAFWLLDPDRSASCFKQILASMKLGPQTPTQSSTEALLEDMGLLSSVMKKLYKSLNDRDMWTLFLCLETKLVNVLAGMELRQISISIHTLLQFSAILKKSLKKLEEKAHKSAGHAFVLNSHHQLRQVLFEELKLDSHLPGKVRLAKTSVTRETSTSETVLTQLLPFHPLPAIILEYRQLQKMKSTYIDGILSCVTDNHLCTHWDQTSAATGRLTSHHPNIQAIPKLPITIRNHDTNYIMTNSAEGNEDKVMEFNARDPFVSKPQWSLLAADFQQIELRLLGHLADDRALINIFTDTGVPDIFNALAAQWMGKSVVDVTDADREQTKRVVYSVMYGVGKEKLAEYLKCSPDSARAIMDSFLLKFPAVNQFTKSCVEYCQKNGYTCSIFKRRRLFPNIKHCNPALRAQAERQCVNFCVQGSAADICKAAMLQVENALAENTDLQARLLVQIHDELLLEVADTDLNKVADLVKSVMESQEKLCGSIVQLKVPIPVSLSVGKTWGHMQPWKSRKF